MSHSANCHRCLIAAGGGSGIPAVLLRGEKTFLRDTLERATEGPRPNLISAAVLFPFPLPLSFPFIFFFLPFLFGSLPASRSILEDKEQVFFPCRSGLAVLFLGAGVGRKPRISWDSSGSSCSYSFCPSPDKRNLKSEPLVL